MTAERLARIPGRRGQLGHRVARFTGLLQKFGDRTQFVVITHNKKTMELNDTLYGVTMEEPGVSKMVSIELT